MNDVKLSGKFPRRIKFHLSLLLTLKKTELHYEISRLIDFAKQRIYFQ
jgi:hypothetical protein